jgi:hypothetical protein
VDDKRIADDQNNGSRKLRIPTYKPIPVKTGWPYLCDSNSDMTVPMTMVESLERVEGFEKYIDSDEHAVMGLTCVIVESLEEYIDWLKRQWHAII